MKWLSRLIIVCGVLVFALTPPAASGHDDPAASLLDRLDAARLMDTIEELPPSRSPRGGEANQRALVDTELWLAEQLRTLGYEPQLLPIEAPGPDYPGAPAAWHNILVEIPGTGATIHEDNPRDRPPQSGGVSLQAPHRAEILILSAHFDCVQGSPGADDDGTGVAALLEIARLLRENPQARTIRLLLFNLEETGLVGSRSYCSDVLRPRLQAGEETVVGMVSLEMLGYFSDEPDSQGSPLKVLPDGSAAPTVGDFIALVGIAAHQEFSAAFADAMSRGAPALPVHRADYFPIPIPDILRSDHAPFLLLNIPAVMLTDTANFRNPNYHRASDSIATIDRERFALVVRAVLGAAIELANPPAEPDPRSAD